MERKRETIINYILILLAVVYVIFVIAYDYYRINVYLDTVERAGDKAGYAVVSMLVYVCYNILILGGGDVVSCNRITCFYKTLSEK